MSRAVMMVVVVVVVVEAQPWEHHSDPSLLAL